MNSHWCLIRTIHNFSFLIYKRLFLVRNFIKYGEYRPININRSQLRLIQVN